jgi:hypothetical protein
MVLPVINPTSPNTTQVMLVINPTSPTKISMKFQSNYHNTQGFPKQQSNRVGKFPWHSIEPNGITRGRKGRSV